jgi:hypothetical protein
VGAPLAVLTRAGVCATPTVDSKASSAATLEERRRTLRIVMCDFL